jgi:hypothetical protein
MEPVRSLAESISVVSLEANCRRRATGIIIKFYIVMMIDALKQARFLITSNRLPHRNEDLGTCGVLAGNDLEVASSK